MGIVKHVPFDEAAEQAAKLAHGSIHSCNPPTEDESGELGTGTVWACEDCGARKEIARDGAQFIGWRNL